MRQLKVEDPNAKPVTVLQRKHAFRWAGRVFIATGFAAMATVGLRF